jgi:hypothetical protein
MVVRQEHKLHKDHDQVDNKKEIVCLKLKGRIEM